MQIVYLTNEQLGRLAGLSQDALAGVQIETDQGTGKAVVVFVSVDDPSRTIHGVVHHDGRWEDQT